MQFVRRISRRFALTTGAISTVALYAAAPMQSLELAEAAFDRLGYAAGLERSFREQVRNVRDALHVTRVALLRDAGANQLPFTISPLRSIPLLYDELTRRDAKRFANDVVDNFDVTDSETAKQFLAYLKRVFGLELEFEAFSGTLTDFRASKLRVRWHSWGEAGTWFAQDELREGKVDLLFENLVVSICASDLADVVLRPYNALKMLMFVHERPDYNAPFVFYVVKFDSCVGTYEWANRSALPTPNSNFLISQLDARGIKLTLVDGVAKTRYPRLLLRTLSASYFDSRAPIHSLLLRGICDGQLGEAGIVKVARVANDHVEAELTNIPLSLCGRYVPAPLTLLESGVLSSWLTLRRAPDEIDEWRAVGHISASDAVVKSDVDARESVLDYYSDLRSLTRIAPVISTTKWSKLAERVREVTSSDSAVINFDATLFESSNEEFYFFKRIGLSMANTLLDTSTLARVVGLRSTPPEVAPLVALAKAPRRSSSLPHVDPPEPTDPEEKAKRDFELSL